MKRFTGLAVTGTMLALALPAAAKGQTVEGGETRPYGPILGARASSLPVPSRRQVAEPAPAQPSGGRLFGGVAVGDNAEVGIGLFTILGATEKKLVRRRTQPDAALRTDVTRVAAVGFSMRF